MVFGNKQMNKFEKQREGFERKKGWLFLRGDSDPYAQYDPIKRVQWLMPKFL